MFYASSEEITSGSQEEGRREGNRHDEGDLLTEGWRLEANADEVQAGSEDREKNEEPTDE